MKVHNPNNLPTIPIADLLATQGNLKDLSETNYKKLKNVIQRRGFSYPVYVWEDEKGIKHLLDGHQRQRVLTTEGWDEPIPYLKIPAQDLQEAMARLLEITSQYATITQEGIDEYIAKYELNEAEVYEATAFDANIGKYDEEEPEVEEDEAPEVDESEPPKSKLGEIYQLGKHRIMCGSATEQVDVELLMNNNKADMIFTDPPYNVNYKGSNGLKIQNDNKDDATFRQFLIDAFNNYCHITKAGGAIYVCHADLEGLNFRYAFKEAGYLLKSTIIWNKNSLVMGRADYHWKHEPILYGWKDGASHSWYGDRSQSTVWDISKPSVNDNHPTMKPVELCAKAIINSSKTDDIVVDLFGGSGSTLIACEQTDRTCYMMELDPKYVDVIRKRWAKFVYPDTWEERWQELTPKIRG